MQPENAHAIDERRKTQTRRIAKLEPDAIAALDAGAELRLDADGRGGLWLRGAADFLAPVRCPYGGPGARLWVRESWCVLNTCPPSCPRFAFEEGCADHRLVVFAANGDEQLAGYMDPDDPDEGPPRWRSPLFLRRVDARLVLVVTAVRLQRVQAITEADAIAEGALPEFEVDAATFVRGRALPESTHLLGYKHGWNRIHGDQPISGRAWASNPPVWAITFEISEVHQ